MKTKSIVFKAGAKKVMDGVNTKLKKHEMGGNIVSLIFQGILILKKIKKEFNQKINFDLDSYF